MLKRKQDENKKGGLTMDELERKITENKKKNSRSKNLNLRRRGFKAQKAEGAELPSSLELDLPPLSDREEDTAARTEQAGKPRRRLLDRLPKDKRDGFQRLVLTFGVLIIVLAACAAINQVVDNRGIGLPAAVESSDVPGPIVKDEQGGTSDQSDTPTVSPENQEGTPDHLLEQTEQDVTDEDNYFVNYRLEREKSRSQQLELLNEVLTDDVSTAETKAQAQNKVMALTDRIEQELLLESLLVAKYGGEAVVFVDDDKANVVLRLGADAKFDDNEAEKIAQLVDTYTGVGYENALIVLK